MVIAAIVISIAVFSFNSGEENPDPVAETSAPADTDDGKDKKTEEPQAKPPKIDKVTALDPEGDNEENDDQAQDVVPNTDGSWRTDRYNSASFGNLKSGVGLLFELEDKTTVKEVKVKSSNSGEPSRFAMVPTLRMQRRWAKGSSTRMASRSNSMMTSKPTT